VWEPACGKGNSVTALLNAGYEVFASDIREWGPWNEHLRTPRHTLDFLSDEAYKYKGDYDILCNPPYGKAKMAMAFIEQGLKLCRNKVVVIVNNSFLYSQSRYTFFKATNPPARVYNLSSRPSMPPGWDSTIKPTGGQTDYSWLVFEKGYRGPTVLDWLIKD